MSDEAEKTQEFADKREEIVSQIKEKGNENLALTIKGSPADVLANKDTVKAWVSAFPEYGEELKELRDEAQDFMSSDQSYNPNDYFKRNKNGQLKFKPDIIAKELENEYKFKYVEDTDTFYVYQDNYWQPRAERLIKEEVNERLAGEYEPRYGSKAVDTIQTRKNVSTRKKEFQPDKDRIPFKNGVYNLNTSTLEPHRPEFNFTHIIPYDYNENAQCPRIMEFLDTVLENEYDKELILETIGYSMLADYPYEHALILYGGGKNGKSVLLNIWKELLDKDNYKEEDLQQLEEGRFATRWLYRKLALFSDDMPSRKLEEGSTLKSLTGGGDTRAEIKGGDHFDFENFATPVFACNEIPQSGDDTDGFFRRWEIVNFPYKFMDNPVKDNHKQKQPKDELMKELTSKEEIEGLINEAIVNLEIIRDNGGFTTKTDAESTRSLWKSYSNPFQQFIENCIEQGMTQQDAAELDNTHSNTDLTEYDYDYIVKDDLVWLIGKYCEHYDKRPPTKTKITRYLKNESPYFVQEGRTRQLTSDSKRDRVYKFLKFSDEFMDFVQEEKKCPECPYFFEHLRVYAREVERSLNKSQDSQDTSSRSVGQLIEDFISNSNSDKVKEQDIVSELDVAEEKIEEKISSMLDNGEIFRPRPGEVQEI